LVKEGTHFNDQWFFETLVHSDRAKLAAPRFRSPARRWRERCMREGIAGLLAGSWWRPNHQS
jgi:hypothetical protein